MAEPTIPDELDTSNEWHVRLNADGSLVLTDFFPGLSGMDFTPDEALILAAWLVRVADPEGHRFNQVLARVLEK